MEKKEDARQSPHIIVCGNPIDGYEFYGPFENVNDAIRYADDNLDYGEPWSFAKLINPLLDKNESTVKTLGDRILYLRNKKRMSQGDLADAVRLLNPDLKCRQSTIHSIESGQVKRPTILYELARALNTTEEFLVTGH